MKKNIEKLIDNMARVRNELLDSYAAGRWDDVAKAAIDMKSYSEILKREALDLMRTDTDKVEAGPTATLKPAFDQQHNCTVYELRGPDGSVVSFFSPERARAYALYRKWTVKDLPRLDPAQPF